MNPRRQEIKAIIPPWAWRMIVFPVNSFYALQRTISGLSINGQISLSFVIGLMLLPRWRRWQGSQSFQTATGTVHDWSTEEILAFCQPGVAPVPLRSAEGKRLQRQIITTIVRRSWSRVKQQIKSGAIEKDRESVRHKYEESYDLQPEKEVSHESVLGGASRPYRINNEVVLDMPHHWALLMRAVKIGDVLEAIDPKSVCEVGCGSGRILFYLANRLRNTEFNGFELTENGVGLANGIKTLPLHETAFGELYGIAESGLPAIRRVEINVGSAFDLPCEDKQFDVVYTHGALEQMADGLFGALSEIRRVTRRYVVFHEPFLEVNDPHGRTLAWVGRWMTVPVKDFEKAGFRLAALFKGFPVPPNMSTGLLVAKVI